MAYVKKIIGNNEHIIGVARLHWMYLAKGIFGFLVCVVMGLAIDIILFQALSRLSDMAPDAGGKMLAVTSSYVTPLSVIAGGFYFLFYLMKVLYTEIALTDKRVIHKTGFIFVKINEIDIEEISAENMDMGYFGSILGYAYIMLDCRFVGDIRLPAIAKANAFVKALHNARTNVVPMYPDANMVAQALVNELPASMTGDEKPEHEMIKPAEPKPIEPARDENGDVIVKAEAAPEEAPASNVDAEHEKEILQLQIAKLELEVKLKEVEAEAETKGDTSDNDIKKPMDLATPVTTPPQTAEPSKPAIAPVDVAAAVHGAAPDIAKMPQVTDKIAEELIASGLIPHPDEIKPEEPFVEEPAHPKAPTDEERLEPTKTDALINSFGGAAFVFKSTEDGNLEPKPAI